VTASPEETIQQLENAVRRQRVDIEVLESERDTLRHDVSVLEGMLHSEQEAHARVLNAYRERREQHLEAQEVIEELKQEVRRLKGEDKCLHCGSPSRFDFCDDLCEECHESDDCLTGYDPRVEDYLMVCERNICGKSRVL
jgi:predicted RNase H-like nuclease (RuvC/YqgF family)